MMERKLTVISIYALNGQMIKQYKGYFHIDYARTNEHEIVFWKDNPSDYCHIYTTQGTIIIDNE
ncbi:MAG: hypothetical protein LUH02_08640 [Erysipelotrichaceae bacterium]|nr:hypothetical protein [Erysipelotrichaceae bacterium]